MEIGTPMVLAKRLKIRLPVVARPEPVICPECPVCGALVSGDINDVNAHIDFCLSNPAPADSEYEEARSGWGRFEIADALPTAAINIDGEESRYGRPQYAYTDIARIIGASPAPSMVLADLPDLPPTASRKELRDRVELQKEQLERTPRCLICLDAFSSPVVSVQCWHVSCELCWCRTLAAKRLCPQCNRITSPEDLRRIYL